MPSVKTCAIGHGKTPIGHGNSVKNVKVKNDLSGPRKPRKSRKSPKLHENHENHENQ